MFDRQALRKQIVQFVEEWINEDEVVVGVLRYGAHIPHIYQNACARESREPKRIRLLLSHMLRFFPPEFYRNNKFLILDDTVYEGVEMRAMLSTLLDQFEIPRDRVRTATLIAHEQSDYEPDLPKPTQRLPDAEYIAWKEELASLVRRDIRPTERDHPLYYFRGGDLSLGKFLSLIQEFGHVHPVGSDWDAPVLRVSLTIDPSLLSDLQALDGLELDPVFKVRLYWQQTEDGSQLTAAPMVFQQLNIPSFLSGSDTKLASLLGLDDGFFRRIYDEHLETSRGAMVYYFVGRAIAALLLERLLIQVIPRLQQIGCEPSCVRPEAVDGIVGYVFPDEYTNFYDAAFERMRNIVEASPAADRLPFAERQVVQNRFPVRASKDPLLPDMYEILEFMTRNSSPATWDGARWMPNKNTFKGTSHRELVKEFGDEVFISAALDELLDSGLLRAKDNPINPDLTCFDREFFPGGEYNAVQVSRIADSWRYQPSAIDPLLAMEEAFDIWGPY
jgi:hypothetical protein